MPIYLAEEFAAAGSWQYAIGANFLLIIGLVYKLGGVMARHDRLESDRREDKAEIAALRKDMIDRCHGLAQVITPIGLHCAVMAQDIKHLQDKE